MFASSGNTSRKTMRPTISVLVLILLFATPGKAATTSEKRFCVSTSGQATTASCFTEVLSPRPQGRTLLDYLRHDGRDGDDEYRRNRRRESTAINLMIVGGVGVLAGLIFFGAAIFALGTIMGTIYSVFGTAFTVGGLAFGIPGIFMYNKYHKRIRLTRRAG